MEGELKSRMCPYVQNCIAKRDEISFQSLCFYAVQVQSLIQSLNQSLSRAGSWADRIIRWYSHSINSGARGGGRQPPSETVMNIHDGGVWELSLHLQGSFEIEPQAWITIKVGRSESPSESPLVTHRCPSACPQGIIHHRRLHKWHASPWVFWVTLVMHLLSHGWVMDSATELVRSSAAARKYLHRSSVCVNSHHG